MNKLALTALVGATCLGLAGCGDNDGANNAAQSNGVSAADEGGGEAAGTGEGGSASASGGAGAGAAGGGGDWAGARIVEENGVTWRVNADGTRVRLGASDARIVTENGVRYRVDPGGTRVRIDPRGAAIDVDLPDVDITPDVDLGRDPGQAGEMKPRPNPDVNQTTTR